MFIILKRTLPNLNLSQFASNQSINYFYYSMPCRKAFHNLIKERNCINQNKKKCPIDDILCHFIEEQPQWCIYQFLYIIFTSHFIIMQHILTCKIVFHFVCGNLCNTMLKVESLR